MVELKPCPVFAGLLQPSGTAAGVIVREIVNPGLATILAAADTLAPRLRDACQMTLQSGARRTRGPAFDLLGTSRQAWLAVGGDGPKLAADLGAALQGAAHLTDQSGAYGLLHLAGPRVADCLAKGLPIDLDASAFGEDAVAVTQVAHIGVIIWRIPGGFALLTPRSSAGSLCHWLDASAAEFGLAVT